MITDREWCGCDEEMAAVLRSSALLRSAVRTADNQERYPRMDALNMLRG